MNYLRWNSNKLKLVLKVLTSFFLVGIPLASHSAPSLIGDSVKAEWFYSGGTFTDTVTVGASPEISCPGGAAFCAGVGSATRWDIQDSSIHYQQTASGGFNGSGVWKFSDLDWSGKPLPIKSFNLSTNIGGLGNSRVSLLKNSVSLDMSNTGGGNVFFDLALQPATFQDIIAGAVHTDFSHSPTMEAFFKPNFLLSLDDAAALGGFTHFQWLQVVTQTPYPLGAAKAPYPDPPLGGQPLQWADNLRFYWDESAPTGPVAGWHPGYLLKSNETTDTLLFSDLAQKPFKPGEQQDFLTSLVGVKPDGKPEFLDQFTWSTNFNPITGHGGVFPSDRNLDLPTEGTGGIFNVKEHVTIDELSPSIKHLLIELGATNIPRDVPEPNTLLLFCFSLLSLIWFQIIIKGPLNRRLQ